MSQRTDPTTDETAYRLGAPKDGLWLAFAPQGDARSRTWQMHVSRRGRGGAKTLANLLQTTALRPLATVTVKGQSYPLPIGWHERKRGGTVCFGGERKLGVGEGTLCWEMRWTPDADAPGRVLVEMRLAATPRRAGDLSLSLHVPLHSPDVWALGAAAARDHCAQSVFSGWGRQAVQFVTLEGESGWDDERRAFGCHYARLSLGGGRRLHFTLGFANADQAEDARAPLLAQYVGLAGSGLHPLEDLPALDPAPALAYLADAGHYAVRGAERLYLQAPDAEPDTFYAGFPHYPLDALRALWDWNRFHPHDDVSRLVRYGAVGAASDFQVMGRGAHAEPNKGAFWDKIAGGLPSDFAGGPTHGLASNARIARALFGLHDALKEPLLRQSALNICQWLILKMGEKGDYGGDRVWATRGAPDDGRMTGSPCSLDGAEAIRPLVMAFRATRNEVFIKAAWKVAHHLMEERRGEFEGAAPPAVAGVILALLALDAEAPNAKLRATLETWGAGLRALPLQPQSPALDADGRHAGLYDCAQAGFALHALIRDPAFLRYAFHALRLVPSQSRPHAWRELALLPTALLSLSALLPGARPDFDALSVALDWRIYAPDPATDKYIRVQAPGGCPPVHALPLVCRQTDQLLLLVLAPRSVEAVDVFKNGRRPLLRDLLAGTLDSDARLHPPGGEDWARVGLFTVDP